MTDDSAFVAAIIDELDIVVSAFIDCEQKWPPAPCGKLRCGSAQGIDGQNYRSE